MQRLMPQRAPAFSAGPALEATALAVGLPFGYGVLPGCPVEAGGLDRNDRGEGAAGRLPTVLTVA